MTATIESLRAEVEYLREQLSGLTGSPDYQSRLRMEFGLTPKQAGILALFMNTSRPVSQSIVYANVYEYPGGDGPDFPIVKVGISQLRRKLESFKAPGRIANSYGTGTYQLSDDLREWVRERVAA
jgi:DNA-binding response OmpR family regulator